MRALKSGTDLEQGMHNLYLHRKVSFCAIEPRKMFLLCILLRHLPRIPQTLAIAATAFPAKNTTYTHSQIRCTCRDWH